MKKTLLILSLWVLLTSIGWCQPVTLLKSPDGNISVNIFTENDNLQMSVFQKKTKKLFSSALGLEVNGANIGQAAKQTGVITRKTIFEQYPIFGNHAVATNYCNEIAIPFQKDDVSFTLILRAYNDGVAIKYSIKTNQAVTITKDLTSFSIPENADCLWSQYDPSYENLTHKSPYASIENDNGLIAPFTVIQKGAYLSFTEAGCVDFPDMIWEKKDSYIQAKFPTNPQGWTAQPKNGSVASPWRVAIIGCNLTQLVNNDLLTNLCDAPMPNSDFSWVKPGRVMWQWWSIGAPQLNDQHQWYDAAAKMKWEYYLIDDGWRVWKQDGKDQWECLKEVIDYGKTVGVKTIIWANSNEMHDRQSIRKYLEKAKQAGAAGVKIDFFPPPTPETMQLYQMMLEETYRLQLMVDFHGCTKPTGLRRTWPNELTREAVRGNEYQMTRYHRLLPQNEYCMTAFTRFLAGPADMTPVIFSASELKYFTWANELAQPIILLSPLTHFADNYKEYINNPVKDLLQQMPVTWDQTIVLPFSDPGNVVGFAKRKGNTWWIGIMNGDHENEISINFAFLKKRSSATIIEDEPETLNAVKRTEKNIRPSDKMHLQLKAGGGAVFRLVMQ